MSDAIRAVDLVMSFRSVQVLNGLNLTVEEGSVFGLVGPNGAGKTTTIKVLMNLQRASSGKAELLGVDSRALGPDDMTRIGYVSENQEMPDWMTVEYLLAYLKPFYPTWDDGRAAELMKQFDLPPTRKLKNLSRGMRMKAALASSLAYRPRLLVLDEPFSGLDPLVREDLIEGLLESAAETTIFVSSHDLGEIETFASHIGYLDRGRLQFSEEMASLSNRFREVEVTFEADAKAPDNLPANWTRVAVAGPVVRFVDTQFDSEGTPAAVRQVYGEPKCISVAAMPLRSIFVAMARNAASGKV
jgi:ABC-2 type transport system ATP-binding protein